MWCAVLYCAVLCCAVLCCAVLCCVVLCCGVLCCAVCMDVVSVVWCVCGFFLHLLSIKRLFWGFRDKKGSKW